MLLSICLVLVAWRGVLGQDPLCDEPEYRRCKMEGVSGFPKTEADIDDLCPKIISHLICVQDYMEKCASPGGVGELVFHTVQAVVAEGCRKNSSLHSRIVQHVGCFHEVSQNDIGACDRFTRDHGQKLHELIQRRYPELADGDMADNREVWRPYQCIWESLKNVCLVSKSADRCGTDAADTALEVISRAGMMMRSCADASEENLAELIQLLELELEEETYLKRLVRSQ